MSYLHPIRLHFAGRFRADVSTVNNRRTRFENAAFADNFRLPFSGGSDGSNWQPAGTSTWRLLDCRVTGAGRADGSFASSAAEDGVVGLSVCDAGDRPSAKLVDLDPDQQAVSMIFGLAVRVLNGRGRALLEGAFEPNAFFDLWDKRLSQIGDTARSAYFQSVLREVEWGDIAGSPCLGQMKQASAAGMLSIKLIADGYHMSQAERGYGRIAGTIGPHFEGEPRTFVMGRHLAPVSDSFAHVVCRVDPERRKVLVDVGNSLPMDTAEVDDFGNFADKGDLTLSIAGTSSLGSLDYRASGSYARTAGVYELPSGRPLSDTEMAALATQPLQLMEQPAGAAMPNPVAEESPDGIYVRAEQFVFRLDPGATGETDLIVSRFGAPLPGAQVDVKSQPLSVPEKSPLPDLATSSQSDASGRIRLTIKANGPPYPRKFIDGQVYIVEFSVRGTAQAATDFDEWNFISVLAFSPISAPQEPTWDDVAAIFTQYSNLYPRPHGPDPYAPFQGLPASHPVVNLKDPKSVREFARHIRRALKLPIEHPNQMPVTRDLSAARRKLLLKWLDGPDGEAKKNAVPAAPRAVAAAQPGLRFASTVYVLPEDMIRRKQSKQD